MTTMAGAVAVAVRGPARHLIPEASWNGGRLSSASFGTTRPPTGAALQRWPNSQALRSGRHVSLRRTAQNALLGPMGTQVTEQYIVGEFSQLLGDLETVARPLPSAVHELRRRVETSPVWRLGPLAQEAMELSDLVCWTALEKGDRGGFRACAKPAGTLREFAENAELLG
jgi:hypothetical protein